MRAEDQDVRDGALTSTSNLVVTAGAGTGKTTLLVDKVLALVLLRGMDVRRILMMTFTEKAANEMRNRLEEELRELDREKWQGPQIEERRAKALADLDRAEIGTIHSFCAHLLREYPVEAGLDPGFQVDQGERFDDLFAREWPRWLDTELGAHPPRAAVWERILDRVKLEELEAAARALCSFRIPLPAMNREKGRELFQGMAAEAIAKLEALAARGSPENRLHQQIVEIIRCLKTGKGECPERLSEAKKGWGALFDEAYDAAAEALPLARATGDDALLDEVVPLLAGFAGKFRETFTREGLVSFDGLLLLVRDLLVSSTFPGIRAEIQARYDFILVDEFQDTDPVQGEVVLFLAEDGAVAEEATEVRLKPGKLFIVGDPKQSIYSFRGADIVAYENLKDLILDQGGEPVILRSNFRSRKTIVDAVNELFPKIIVRNGSLQPEYEKIWPTHPEGPKIELLLFSKKDGDIKSEEARDAEALAIAGRIRKDGMKFKDVAILLRALTDVNKIVEALRAEEIPYVVEGEKYFYTTQEVTDFVNLLAAIANPEDKIALAGVLRSPMGALDDRALYEIRKSFDYRKPAPLPELKDLWAMLREEHARASEMGLAEFLDGLFERTFVLETAAAGFHGEQAVANLLKLRETARAFEASTAGTLAAFLQRLRAAMRDLEDEGESPLADEDLDAVKILSIHKSKGLEFPIVFLPDLHHRTRGGEPPTVRFDWTHQALGFHFRDVGDPADAALTRLDELRRREETRRLLYVAMTRAKDRLLLSGSAKFGADTFLGLLDAAGARGVMTVEERPARGAAPSPRRGERTVKEPLADWAGFDAAWRARESRKDVSRFTSVTRLEEKIPHAAGGVSRGAEIGIACHEILEKLDFAKPKWTAADPDVREILETFQKSSGFRELAESEILARELPFLIPHGDRILEGYIDVVYRSKGKVWVGDYKTDVKMNPEGYALAKDVYTRAVRDALGLEVAGFKLFYLRHGKTVMI